MADWLTLSKNYHNKTKYTMNGILISMKLKKFAGF